MGREAFVLSDMGFAVTGIDISHKVISQVTAFHLKKIMTSVLDGMTDIYCLMKIIRLML